MNSKLFNKLLCGSVWNSGKYSNGIVSVQKQFVNNRLHVPHVPVMLKESVECLQIQSKSVIADFTFGAGGHTKEILSKYDDCQVLAVDRDKMAFDMATQLSSLYSGRVTPILEKFSNLSSLLSKLGYAKGSLDGVLIDAGCSSMQFDEPLRGFSFSKDGPLDMRMDGDRDDNQITAADVVNYLSVEDLTKIISKYGEERKAEEIAQAIADNRPFTRTKQLAETVALAVSPGNFCRTDALGRRSHSATKTFMALRIFVNDEMNELKAGISCAEKYLRHGGRLVVISFHSLEDRLIRTSLRKVIEHDHRANDKKVIIKPWILEKDLYCCPSEEETSLNPRARSAFLRVATRNRPT